MKDADNSIFAPIKRKILENATQIDRWFESQFAKYPPPFYTSCDIRFSGFKAAPIDNNLFPAGFNNLCLPAMNRSSIILQQYFARHYPNITKIAILAESHSRNIFYYKNLSILKKIIEKAGFTCILLSQSQEWAKENVDTQDANLVHLDNDGDKLDIRIIDKEGHYLSDNNENIHVLVLNNDLSDGISQWMNDLNIPIIPPIKMGWHTRKKSHHRQYYDEIVQDFADFLDMDSFFLRPLYDHVDGMDFSSGQGLEELAQSTDQLLLKIAEKYKEYNISQKPYAFIKNNSGTYGMGIMTVQNGAEVLKLNRKKKNKMNVGKGGRAIDSVIIEEGISTIENVFGLPSEPVIYLFCGKFAGGFYRYNSEKGAKDNLNSSGMSFHSYCKQMPEHRENDITCHCDPDWESLYGIIGRLSCLGGAKEIFYSS